MDLLCLSHRSESDSGMVSLYIPLYRCNPRPPFLSFCLQPPCCFLASFLLYPFFPLPSQCFPFSAPSSQVLRSSTWTTSKSEACSSSHFPGHIPHLPDYLTWLLQRIPGTFLGVTGKKWFAKCHFFLFLFFQQHAAWFRTKVDRSLASLWTRST